MPWCDRDGSSCCLASTTRRPAAGGPTVRRAGFGEVFADTLFGVCPRRHAARVVPALNREITMFCSARRLALPDRAGSDARQPGRIFQVRSCRTRPHASRHPSGAPHHGGMTSRGTMASPRTRCRFESPRRRQLKPADRQCGCAPSGRIARLHRRSAPARCRYCCRERPKTGATIRCINLRPTTGPTLRTSTDRLRRRAMAEGVALHARACARRDLLTSKRRRTISAAHACRVRRADRGGIGVTPL